MNRIVRFHEIGPPEVLRIEQADPTPPAAGEVLLRVRAFGLNNSEAQYRRGEYPMKQAAFPSRLGRECVGTVIEAASDVTGIRRGADYATIPAFDIQHHGVYGEWAVVPAHALVPVPRGLSALQGAAVWQQYLTAYGPLVEYTQLEPGDWVLVTAAASSVGLGAIQVARRFGARVVGTTRSPSKAAAIRAAGAEAVVVTGDDDEDAASLAGRLREAAGGAGFRLVFDAIAGAQVRASCEAAQPGATVFLYGQLSRQPVDYPLVTCLAKGLSVRGYTLWEITLDAARRARAVAWITQQLESGHLSPVIDRCFAFDDIVQAHRYLESGRQCGKIVVSVSEGTTEHGGTR